jgi:hypothetical protein
VTVSLRRGTRRSQRRTGKTGKTGNRKDRKCYRARERGIPLDRNRPVARAVVESPITPPKGRWEGTVSSVLSSRTTSPVLLLVEGRIGGAAAVVRRAVAVAAVLQPVVEGTATVFEGVVLTQVV